MRRIAIVLAGLGMAFGCTEGTVEPLATASAPAPLALLAVTPVGGPPGGGTTITLHGSGMHPGCTVAVGGVAATLVTVASGTTSTALVPAGVAGTVGVDVTNPDGTTVSLASAYTYTSLPLIVACNPATGDTAGGTPVTVSGAAFSAGCTVRFGSATSPQVVVLDSGTLVAFTPAGAAGAVSVIVTDPVGWAGVLNNAFTYVAPARVPTASGVTPSSGPSAGGTPVTVTGAGFGVGTTVAIGGLAAATTVVDGFTLIAITPPVRSGMSGTLPVTVVTAAGGVATNTTPGFTYADVPVEASTDLAVSADIAADTNGVLHGVWQAQSGTTLVVRYVRSTDGGATWSAGATLGTTGPSWTGPKIAVGGGVIAVVWPPAPGGGNCLAWSADGGSTFAGTALQGIACGDPAIAVDAAGRLCVAFTAVAPGLTFTTEVHAVTGPAGGTLSGARLVSGSLAAFGPSVASPAAGTFCVGFVGAGIARDAYCSRTTDGGATFAGPSALSAANPMLAEMVDYVRLAARGGRVVCTWTYQPTMFICGFGGPPNPPTASGAFLRGSTDGGATFGPMHQVHLGSVRVNVAVDGQGALAATWVLPNVSGGADLWCQRSHDGGLTVASPSLDFTRALWGGMYTPAMAALPHRLYHVWVEAGPGATGGWDIRGY